MLTIEQFSTFLEEESWNEALVDTVLISDVFLWRFCILKGLQVKNLGASFDPIRENIAGKYTSINLRPDNCLAILELAVGAAKLNRLPKRFADTLTLKNPVEMDSWISKVRADFGRSSLAAIA